MVNLQILSLPQRANEDLTHLSSGHPEDVKAEIRRERVRSQRLRAPDDPEGRQGRLENFI